MRVWVKYVRFDKYFNPQNEVHASSSVSARSYHSLCNERGGLHAFNVLHIIHESLDFQCNASTSRL